VNFVLQLYTGI